MECGVNLADINQPWCATAIMNFKLYSLRHPTFWLTYWMVVFQFAAKESYCLCKNRGELFKWYNITLKSKIHRANYSIDMFLHSLFLFIYFDIFSSYRDCNMMHHAIKECEHKIFVNSVCYRWNERVKPDRVH